eukprot:10441037-Lingulodinium_polyedra.AAC.1
MGPPVAHGRWPRAGGYGQPPHVLCPGARRGSPGGRQDCADGAPGQANEARCRLCLGHRAGGPATG